MFVSEPLSAEKKKSSKFCFVVKPEQDTYGDSDNSEWHAWDSQENNKIGSRCAEVKLV